MTQHASPDPSVPVATFCGNCDCGCPQLFYVPDADEERRVQLTDDFGQRVEMSSDQFASLLTQAKEGTLDHLTR
ncbi:hypothetical protein [Streptomyces sp. HNM0574]|uniref:hypothetical protein n=1 Tax=Streptomyces sp. HNM0574 TaxID=2714954 RepID=UPI00146DA67D|nr:hypothetical protein [Streptomyces sp. HNM0574]NLU68620.1 hypothetical protein [Streptomyces sp. HNM0574]